MLGYLITSSKSRDRRMTDMGVTCFIKRSGRLKRSNITEYRWMVLKTQGSLSHFENWMHVGLLHKTHKTMTPRLKTRFLHWRSHLVVATSVVLFSVAPLAPGPWQTAKWCKTHCYKSSQWLVVWVHEKQCGRAFISFHSTACRVFNCSDVSPLPGDTRTKRYFWSWMIWRDKIITWIVGCHPTNHIQQKLNSFRRC